jgi:DNA ligase 1
MRLAEIVATSAQVASTRSRKAKVAALANRLDAAPPEQRGLVTAYLAGTLLQRRTGLGWRSMSELPPPAAASTLTVAEVDESFARIAALTGAGSQAARSSAVIELFGRATAEEQVWLRGVVTGEVRQGALDSLVQEALAAAAGAPLTAVRRAAMLAGSTVAVAGTAFEGEAALAAVGLTVGRPVLPMLAASASTVAEAMGRAEGPVAIDAKLDGIRIQVHRTGEEVVIASRTLDDLTDRLPEVVELARSLPAYSLVLDGEALTVGPDGRPRPFQETSARTATRGASATRVHGFFFDLLHLDGRDLIDEPLAARLAALDALVPAEHRVRRLVTADAAEAESFAADVLGEGQEGVVVKSLQAPWDAGRRGGGWVKVKPVITLDLVVLAAEWGSGRRKGWLSNIHLGARDPESGGFVMLGKTFKGMTDAMLAWQTERFTELALEGTERTESTESIEGPQGTQGTQGWVVPVRPEQVVEIAFDGLQRSTRYPGGVALRFARVVRYRDDKPAEEADTIATVRSLMSLPGATDQGR